MGMGTSGVPDSDYLYIYIYRPAQRLSLWLSCHAPTFPRTVRRSTPGSEGGRASFAGGSGGSGSAASSDRRTKQVKKRQPARLSWISADRSHNAGALQSAEAPPGFTDIPHIAALNRFGTLPTLSIHLKQFLGQKFTRMHPLAFSGKVPRHRLPVRHHWISWTRPLRSAPE